MIIDYFVLFSFLLLNINSHYYRDKSLNKQKHHFKFKHSSEKFKEEKENYLLNNVKNFDKFVNIVEKEGN